MYIHDETIKRIYECYDSPILEGFKKKAEYKKSDLAKREFFKYLKKQYPEFDKKEFTEAKSKEDIERVIEKYKDDFDRFVDEQPKLFFPMAVRWGLVAADTVGLVPKHVRFVLQRILFIDNLQYNVKRIKKKFEK